jgi:hypothetical protein
LANGTDFTFPIGNGDRYGELKLFNPQNGVTWTAQYFEAGYNSANVNTVAPNNLVAVSTTEHWKIVPSSDGTAKIGLRWDVESDINPATTTSGINDIVVAEYRTDPKWYSVTSDSRTGDNNSGYLQTASAINISSSGTPQYFTLGSTTAVTAKAKLASSTPICGGTPIPVTFSGVTSANLPYRFTYQIGVTDQPVVEITNVSQLPYSISTTGLSGVFKLKTGSFNYTVGSPNYNTTGIVGVEEITVYVTPSSSTITNGERCGTGIVTVSASGAVDGVTNYKWYSAATFGTLLQTNGSTYTTPSISTTTSYWVSIYNTSTLCESPRTKVDAIIKPTSTIEISSISIAETCEGTSVSLTLSILTTSPTYSYNIRRNGTIVASRTQASANPYTFTTEWLDTSGTPPAKAEFVFTVTDFIAWASGCDNIIGTSKSLIVWKLPVTGPQYHIPNTFGE